VSPPPTPPDSFWHRRVAAPIGRQLTQGITPEKIALTLAVGTAFAFFPILGTTTLLCLFVGIFLRLNQPLIQLVNGLCTLPHLLVIYGLIRFGGFIFGVPPPPRHGKLSEFIFSAPKAHLNIYDMVHVIWRDHGQVLHRFELTALHAIVAWALIAPFWIYAVYRLTLPPLRRRVPLQVPAPLAAPNPKTTVPMP
jgi:hypothetical protein